MKGMTYYGIKDAKSGLYYSRPGGWRSWPKLWHRRSDAKSAMKHVHDKIDRYPVIVVFNVEEL
jgi:hypothetical protein